MTRLQCMMMSFVLLAGLISTQSAIAEVTGASVDESNVEVTLYVAQHHKHARDEGNNGRNAKRPLKTIGRAFHLAEEHLKDKVGTKIVIGPGVYREKDPTTRIISRHWRDDQRDAVLVIEGTKRGDVIISGSEDRSGGWRPVPDHPGLYSKPWPHRWGLGENQYYERFGVIIEALGNRREMIWLNGQRLTPVLIEKYKWHDPDGRAKRDDPDGLANNNPGEWKAIGLASLDAIKPGMFGVTEKEENNPQIYIHPPEGINLNKAKVEIAMEDSLLRINWRRNVVIRNLVFQHSNSGVCDGLTAVVIYGENILVENCDFIENNARALTFGAPARSITVRNCKLNYNGWRGLGATFPDNMLLVDNESNFNNWRGALGNQFGCDAAGVKIIGPHGPVGVHVIRHQALGNLAHGLWFDHVNEPIAPVTIEDSYFVGNYRFQLYLEKQAGPVLIKRCVMWNNDGKHALSIVGYNMTVENCILYTRKGSLIHVGGRNNSPYRWMKYWTLRGNVFALGTPKSIFFHTYQGQRTQEHNKYSLTTLTAEANLYVSPDGPNHRSFIGVDKWRVPFEEWKSVTGADHNSIMIRESPFVNAAKFDWRLKPQVARLWPNPNLPGLLPEDVVQMLLQLQNSSGQ